MNPRPFLLALVALPMAGCERGPEATPQARQQENATAASTRSVQADTSSLVPSGGWREGVHYERIMPPQPTGAGPNHIEVVEFFWFSCPHCRDLEPALRYWRHRAPDDVQLIRVPVTWHKEHERTYARMYFTLQRLGRPDLYLPFYDAIDAQKRATENKQRLESPQDQQAFAVKHGVDAQTFSMTYHSEAVSAAVAAAEKTAQDYRISSTPTVIVQGKYLTSIGRAGGLSEVLAVTDALIARERGE